MLHEADHISHKKQRQCHNIRHNVVMLSHKLIVRHVPMQHCSQECLSDNRMPLLTACITNKYLLYCLNYRI